MKPEQAPEHLPEGLRNLVHQAVEILGEVIRHELGDKKFERIDRLRLQMAALRKLDHDEAVEPLRDALKQLKLLSSDEQIEIAQAYTLMLEVMNSCENAYRSHRIAERNLKVIIYECSCKRHLWQDTFNVLRDVCQFAVAA